MLGRDLLGRFLRSLGVCVLMRFLGYRLFTGGWGREKGRGRSVGGQGRFGGIKILCFFSARAHNGRVLRPQDVSCCMFKGQA